MTKAKKKPLPAPAKFLSEIPDEVRGSFVACAEYKRVIALLEGRLDERDRSLLSDYAITHSEIIELRTLVSRQGRMFEGTKGGYYINPIVNLLSSRQAHIAQLRRDLYFTPKSRIEKQAKATQAKGTTVRDKLDNDENDGVQD